MAELEIHTEHEGDKDPVGKKVGILAAVLAVFLAIVTIASHRCQHFFYFPRVRMPGKSINAMGESG